MQENAINWNGIIKATLFSLMIVLIIFVASFLDNRTKIVFCDVGQGDAAYIRIKNKIDVLIDAGPDRKILDCLGKYMPFYDRKIEIAIISHPQKDHYYGMNYILDRYQIGQLFISPFNNSSSSYLSFTKKLSTKKIKPAIAKSGLNLNLLNDKLICLWPAQNFLARTNSLDDNDFSLIFIFQQEKFRALFTGDASPAVLNILSSRSNISSTLLKIPHHGSKNGLTQKFLVLADPQVAVISVGKNNSYGHPSSEVLAMLKAQKIQIRRTDREGDLVFNLIK